MLVNEQDYEAYLLHYGTPRHSGRYPWGSGEDPYQRSAGFYNHVNELKKAGLTQVEIAKSMGMTTTQLRAKYTNAKDVKKDYEYQKMVKLKEKGWSNSAIAREFGINESSVRSKLDPLKKERNQRTQNTANALADAVKNQGFIDVGAGVEAYLGVSSTMKNNALALLEEQGYSIHNIKVQQAGTGKNTTIKVLAPEGTSWAEVINNQDKIHAPGVYSEKPNGELIKSIRTPVSLDSKRIYVRYAEDGGTERDGTIELRRGVKDIALGDAAYAQVRIAVDGSHYLKGMALYRDDIPKGYDVVFNTNKSKDTPMMGDKDHSVLKPMKNDDFNPFGATIKRQLDYIGKDGKEHQSVVNIVNEQGDWSNWSKTLSSQMLSKQSPALAKQQLDKAYKARKAQFDELNSLTNPVIKAKMLMDFGDECDSAAVHLKAAALPRQAAHVILPISSLKNNEIYAPRYRDGEEVALVRYPHAGIFEIPLLRVNNKNKEGKSVIGNKSPDAIGIHHSVAEQLSGADFDGDTALVIPTRGIGLKASKPLKSLQTFDPKKYKLPDGAAAMSDKTKQQEMGKISNLITDMTIAGASPDELVRAVKHSMVVIDAPKHRLDYKQSYEDHNIAELKKKYRGGSNAGASTLISRASAPDRVHTYREKIDPKTGAKKRIYTDETYIDKNGQVKYRTTKVARMTNYSDAYKLSSGTPMENVYAEYANNMKALGNESRRISVNTKAIPYSPQAAQTYSKEVARLNEGLRIAKMNAPLERKAQMIANARVKAALKEDPEMDGDHKKRLRGQAISAARESIGAKKTTIHISDKEWEAIQAGAISKTKLMDIINNSDSDRLKQLATPRTQKKFTPATISRAKQMAANGSTQADIADALGVSTSTVYTMLNTE